MKLSYNHTRGDSYLTPCPECKMTELAILGAQLAKAVLLFYGSEWTEKEVSEWVHATGSNEATTKTLGHLARKVLDAEKKCSF